MFKALKIEPRKCTGCLQCELACSFEHEAAYNPSKSRIKVFTFHDTAKFVPYTCTQCADAWCATACPTEAITTDRASGVKTVSDALCVGCKVCTAACPFGTINYNAATTKVIKCDLCGGKPACAEACPTGAITFADGEWAGYDRMKSWAARTDTAVEPHA